MKTSFTKISAALALMTLSGVAMAGIANTKHNMGGSTNMGNSGAGWNYSSATSEICVFCHTPHGGDNKAAAPLWNRALSSSSNYTTYASLGTTTMDAVSSGIGSVSLACLSCHDGTQALNSMLNGPGPGGGALGAGTMIGTAASAANPPNVGGFWEFTAMSDVTGEPIYLSTDLSNDHPISMQYAGQLSGTGGRPLIDPDFKPALRQVLSNAKVVWYVPTDTNGSKDKTDLPLYTRPAGDLSEALADQPLVECATCHDPHTQNTTFLRNPVGNEGSQTCLTCHVK